jgi:hypothetical protein
MNEYPPPATTGLKLVNSYSSTGVQHTWAIFSGLALSISKKYKFIYKGKNASVTGVEHNFLLNGDTTQTNYYTQKVTNSSTTNSSQRENKPTISGTIPNGTYFQFEGIIATDEDGRVRITGNGTYASASAIEIVDFSVIYNVVVASITALTLTYNGATSCLNGATFDLYEFNY